MAQAPTTPETFWRKVEKTDSCWLWRGCVHYLGYGVTSVGGKQVRAHRLAWTYANGPIPDGLLVRHKCDVPLCVNPDHLLLGTYADNAADMVSRGRQAKGDRNGRSTHPESVLRGDDHPLRKNPHLACHGSRHHAAKLTEQTVSEILRRVRPYGARPRGFTKALAAEFQVSQVLIQKILKGELWKHMQQEAA